MSFRSLVSLIAPFAVAAGLFAGQNEALAQTAPDPTQCAQNGGSRLCKAPLIGPAPKYDGSWGYFYQVCNSTTPVVYASSDAQAISQAVSASYSSPCVVTNMTVGDYPTPANQGIGDGCGYGEHLWPGVTLGIESGNRHGVTVGISCPDPQPPHALVPNGTKSAVIFRYRDVTCPAGYETVLPNGPNDFLCAAPVGVKCLTCYDDYLSQGNPVNAGTQTKYQVETDFTVAGSPLQIVRYYNSRMDHGNNSFGTKWRSNYDRSLTQGSANVIHAHRADGAVLTFWQASGAWYSDSDVNQRFSAVSDPLNPQIVWALRETDDSVENYGSDGKLLSIVYRGGQTISFVYAGNLTTVTDSFGRSLQISSSPDSDGVNKVRSITAPDNTVYTYSYIKSAANNTNDPQGNPTDAQTGDPTFYVWMLSGVNYPDGGAKGYLYGEPQNLHGSNLFPDALTGITDENSDRYATYTYTFSGAFGNHLLPESTGHAGGVDTFTFTYNSTGSGSVNVMNPLGRITSNIMTTVNNVPLTAEIDEHCYDCTYSPVSTYGDQYDANRNTKTRSDADGRTATFQYDLTRNLETSRTDGAAIPSAPVSNLRTTTTTWHPTFRLPATITEPLASGTRTSTLGYDGNGNLISRSVTTPQGTRTWSWTYDDYGRVLTATDPRQNVSTNTYYPNDPSQGAKRGMLASVTNAYGHTTTIDSYTANGQPLSITDANGLNITLTYDPRMRLLTRNIGGETTKYRYDFVGQLVNVILPDGSTLDYTYDPAHRLVQIADGLGNRIIYTLDNMGNRVQEDVLDPSNQLARTRARFVNQRGQMEQDVGGALGQVTNYVYDNSGNWLTMSDPAGKVTQRTLDSLARTRTLTDPTTGVTQYQYDPQDNLTQVTDPKNLSTIYSYNGFNELTSQTSPDTGVTGFSYDNAGNMTGKTDARGVTGIYQYDSLNRVTLISYPDEMVSYVYDNCPNGKGRLCYFSDKTGMTSYTYDTKGRVLAKAQTVGGLAQTVSYTYNSAGQMDSMTLPSGSVLSYNYGNNRLIGISLDGTPVTMNADYEPFGPIGEWAWGNDSPSAPNQHVRYFDTDGRNTKIESGAGIDPQVIVYDTRSRITDLQKLTNGVVDPAKSISFGYDDQSRLLTATPGAGNPAPAQTFGYDGVGNRTSQKYNGSTTTYNYNNASSSGNHRLNSLSGAVTKNFSYDAAGNKTGDGVQTWTYGSNNRPAQISFGSGANTVNVLSDINALGQRVRKTVPVPGGPPDITRFVYDEAGRLIGEYKADGTPIREHIWMNDLPVGVVQ